VNWLSLPGPGRFLRRIAEAVNSGVSGSLTLPAFVNPADVVSALRESHQHGEVVVLEAGLDFDQDHRPLQAVAEGLGIAPENSSEPRTAAEEVGERCLVVLGIESVPEESTNLWFRFADAFYRSQSERSNDGSMVLVSCGSAFKERPRDDVGVRHWDWWSLLSQEDIHTHLRFMDGVRNDDRLRVYQSSEVCGGDLELAERLMECGPADISQMTQVIRDRGAELGLSPLDPRKGAEARKWDALTLAGTVQSIAGQPLLHPACLLDSSSSWSPSGGTAELNRRLWLSQLKAMLPTLELWKELVADLAVQEGVLTDQEVEDAEEIRDLDEACRKSVSGSKTARSRIRKMSAELRSSRNKLAHRTPLGPERIQRLKTQMGTVTGEKT